MEFQGLSQPVILFFVTICCLVFPLYADTEKLNHDVNTMTMEDQVHIGVILDMGSLEGQIVQSCISMALSDFYHLHNNYSTRVILHNKDSKGKPLPAMSAAFNLLDNIKVEAIIGAQTKTEAKFLAELGEAAQLPVMSLCPPFTDNIYAFFVEIMRSDQAAEVKGISAIVELFKWRDVVLLYDDKEYERDFIQSLVSSFQETTRGSVVCKSSNIASSSSNEDIIEELQKLMKLNIKVFVVQVSHLLAPRLFLYANKLGMMIEGYTWIVTSTSMNFLHSMDLSVIESMRGVLGFKSSIPASLRLHSLTSRLRRKFQLEDPNMEAIRDFRTEGIWAYDATWALAEAVERARLKSSTTRTSKGVVLLREIMQNKFNGLSGEIYYLNGKLISSEPFEIVNVIEEGEIKRIGFWPSKEEQRTRKGSPSSSLVINSWRSLVSTIDIGQITWPGGSKRDLFINETTKKLRIGVPVRVGFKELVRVEHLDHNQTRITGFAIDVFKAAIGALSYKVDYELIPFEDANGNSAGSYNDLVHQVYLEIYDAVVGDITITWNRSQYVDFTLPYTDFGVGTLVRNRKSVWFFFRPLSLSLWLTSAAFFILTACVVWLIERPTNEEFQGTANEQIGMVLWFAFSTVVFAFGQKLSNNLAKFVVIIWVFIVLILTSSYTATLASMMTVNQIQFNSIGNRIGYQLGSLGAILNMSLSESQPLKKDEDYYHALTKGSKNGGVSGIIDEIPYINIFLARYPDFSMIKTDSVTNGFAFAFPKGSHLARDVSMQIEYLRQEGMLLKMERTWFYGKTEDEDESSRDPTTISLMEFRGLFIISGASLLIALLLSQIFRIMIRRLLRLIRGQPYRLKMFINSKILHRN